MHDMAIPPFERFYEEHRSEVLRLLRRRLGAERADDAFQETFLRALQAYGRLEHGEHLRAWILTIAKNVAVDTLRRARPQSELVDTDPESHLERLARIAGPRVLRSPRSVDPVRRELEEYFEGRRQAFDLPLDLRALPPFTVEVLRELARVPYGETTTYGALAARVGRPRAARAVGTVMNRNRIPIVLPCHRVVGSTGDLVGYAGGLDRKLSLLRLEGALQ